MLTAEDTTTEQVPQWKVEGLLSALDDPILEVQAEAWSRFAYLRGVYVNRLRYRPFPGEGVRYTFSESAMARFQSRLHSLVKLADHQSSYVRSAAARALGTLGEAAKSQVPRIGELLKDEDSSVRSAAAEALGALGEAAKSEASKIGELLKDDQEHPLLTAATFARLDVRYAATMNLERIAPLQAGVTQLWILNPIHRDFSRRGKLRFLCHFISASNQDLSRHGGDENEKQNKVKIWLRYLGKPGEYTDNPSGPTARRHLQALLDAWQASDAAKTSLRDIRKECAEAMAGLAGKVIGTVGPDGKDLSLPRFLQFVYTLRNEKELLRQAKLLEGVQTVLASAEAEGEAIENAQSRVSQELRLLRSRLVILKRLEQGITTVLIHGGFWALLIFVYPSSTMVQALFFWNPWVRRTVGFPYVGLLLTWVPFLRQRLLSPFRETLVPRQISEGFQDAHWYANSQLRNLRTREAAALKEQIPEVKGQFVLQGASGLGKTMFLKHLIAGRSKRLRVFLRAEDCAVPGQDEFGSVIESISLRMEGAARDRKFLRNLVFSGALDIYIDGLNEVSAETRVEITNFLNRYTKGNIILTTQPVHKWEPPRNAHLYELLPLDREQIEEFLHSRADTLPETAKRTGDEFKSACTNYLERTLPSEDSSNSREAQIVLSNPMDLTIVAELIAQGEEPDLFALQQHQYTLVEREYKEHTNRDFPLKEFSRAVLDMRLKDESVIPSEFDDALEYLHKQKMVIRRQETPADGEESYVYTFRHDKIMELFIVQTFLHASGEQPMEYMDDPRFKGVYLMLALLLPQDEADVLREAIIDYSAENDDYSVSNDFIKLLKARKERDARSE
ncbi:MAG: HEAT repeat domain-containing protein [Planctomycetota bacterium]|nr:HEAT repeat domain-containing protein [Planctomycetota bacterium]